MVHLSGWYDPYARTAMENYTGLADKKRGPVRLVLGPWTHGDRSLSFAGDVEFGSQALLDGNLGDDFFAVRRAWFDCWVKGIDNGVADEPAVRVFVIGGGRLGDGVGRRNADGRLEHGGFWRTGDAWPLPQTEFTRFYLHPGRSLLVATPGEAAASLSFVADQHNPLPTIGGALSSGGPVMYSGACDQRTGPHLFGAKPPYGPLALRSDVLVFQTPPLPQDLEIAGPIELKLWVATDGPDADIHAKLVDLYPPGDDYPDGFAMNLCEGLLRLRYRDSWEAPTLLEPERPYRVTVAMFPCANLFKRGHRLRLDLAGSNFPHFDVNPNSGEPEGAMEHPRRATTTIFVDSRRPSHLVLPIIPRGR
jgi:putative CocE/NonD family hydrolase